MGFGFSGGGSGGGGESIQSITYHDSLYQYAMDGIIEPQRLRVSPTARKAIVTDGNEPALRVIDFTDLDNVVLGEPQPISTDGTVRDIHIKGEHFFFNKSTSVVSHAINGTSITQLDTFDKNSVPRFDGGYHPDSCLLPGRDILYTSRDRNTEGYISMAFDISSPENISLIGTFENEGLMANILGNTGISAYYDEDTELSLSINTPQQTNFIPMDASSPLNLRGDTAPQTSALPSEKAYNTVYSTLGNNGPEDVFVTSALEFMETKFG